MSQLSDLPSVERLLRTPEGVTLAASYGRPLTLDAIRTTLEDVRGRVREDEQSGIPGSQYILEHAKSYLRSWMQPGMMPVINATGVILHTNLGRAPLSNATIVAMREAGKAYTNLEFDLQAGKRSDRLNQAQRLLQRVTGAEAGIVVNNNAAAVLLALSALARARRVIIARSQLVEIGGGFRMPEVMRQSGAKLVEVGTTNRVSLWDYTECFPDATVVLRAHRSNFKLVGFTEEPDFREVVSAAHEAGLVVIDDLGSGALLDTAAFGISHEPMVQESIEAGADLVCFSGDKLVGGPQAGIVVGREELVARLRKHPLARAVRADKTTLAGVEANLEHYARNEAATAIPVWRMIGLSLGETRRRALEWQIATGVGDVVETESTLGGGSLPGEALPTAALSVATKHANGLLSRLRAKNPPVIARAEKGKVLLDPRTVLPEQDAELAHALDAAVREAE
jgi:L-seryl-tRNA(Ser) seleniumtransferase